MHLSGIPDTFWGTSVSKLVGIVGLKAIQRQLSCFSPHNCVVAKQTVAINSDNIACMFPKMFTTNSLVIGNRKYTARGINTLYSFYNTETHTYTETLLHMFYNLFNV